MLTLADLFLVGLILDISGAVLLAKGLLLSPRILSKLDTYWGLEQGQHQDRVENRVTGEFGVACLITGFALQFLGYCLDIGGVSSRTGGGRLLTALGMAGVAGILALAGWRLFRRERTARINAAIEREGPEASREIADVDDREGASR